MYTVANQIYQSQAQAVKNLACYVVVQKGRQVLQIARKLEYLKTYRTQYAVTKFIQQIAPLYVKLNNYMNAKIVRNCQYYFSKWQVEVRIRETNRERSGLAVQAMK